MSRYDDYPTITNTSIHAWGVTKFQSHVYEGGGYMAIRIDDVATIYLSPESANRMLSALHEGISALAAQEVPA